MTVAASNALHYPFLTAFNQARIQRLREDAEQRQQRLRGDAAATAGAGVAVAAAGDAAGRAAAPVADGKGVGVPVAGEAEYEFNQGEQLMLQARPWTPLLRSRRISHNLARCACACTTLLALTLVLCIRNLWVRSPQGRPTHMHCCLG